MALQSFSSELCLSITLHSLAIFQVWLLSLILFLSFVFSVVKQLTSAILSFFYESMKIPTVLREKEGVLSCPIPSPRTTFPKYTLKLSRCATQLCPNIFRVIYTGSTSFRHEESSCNYINTEGNETQNDGFRDWEGWLRCPYILLKEFLLDSVEFTEWTVSTLVKTSNRTQCGDKGSGGGRNGRKMNQTCKMERHQ